jgi:hypothetical protein
LIPLICSVLPCLVLAIGAIPSRIEVGVDGILIRWMRRSQFIPLGEIQSVEAKDTRAILLHYRSGRSEIIYTGNARKLPKTERVHRDKVLASIREAMVERDAKERSSATINQQGSLIDLAKRAAQGYREPAIRHEELWRTIEEPCASEQDRAAAAVLLRYALDAGGRERVRVAAMSTASPKLRVVFDATASESEELLDHAIRDFAPAEQARLGVVT